MHCRSSQQHVAKLWETPLLSEIALHKRDRLFIRRFEGKHLLVLFGSSGLLRLPGKGVGLPEESGHPLLDTGPLGGGEGVEQAIPGHPGLQGVRHETPGLVRNDTLRVVLQIGGSLGRNVGSAPQLVGIVESQLHRSIVTWLKLGRARSIREAMLAWIILREFDE